MTAILETHVTGAMAELFFCRHVEGTHRLFVHGKAVIVQEALADHFNPSPKTAVDGVIIALVWKCGQSRHAFFFTPGRACRSTNPTAATSNPMGQRACLQRRRRDLRW